MGFSTGYSNRKFFTPAWVDRLKGIPERGMNAKVRFTDPKTQSVVLDNVPARIQPIRSAVPKDNLANDTRTQVILVSIPIDQGRTLDLRPRHRAVVIDCPLMPVLKNFLYIASEVSDSSNAIERTFQFTVDIEAVWNGS